MDAMSKGSMQLATVRLANEFSIKIEEDEQLRSAEEAREAALDVIHCFCDTVENLNQNPNRLERYAKDAFENEAAIHALISEIRRYPAKIAVNKDAEDEALAGIELTFDRSPTVKKIQIYSPRGGAMYLFTHDGSEYIFHADTGIVWKTPR